MTKKVSKYLLGYDNYDPYYESPTDMGPFPIGPPVSSKNNRTLKVSANPSELTDSEIVSYFSHFGPIEEVNIPFNKTVNKWNGFLYIVFDSVAIVDQLIENPTKMLNGKKVLVSKKGSSNSSNGGWVPSPLLNEPVFLNSETPAPSTSTLGLIQSMDIPGPSGLGGSKYQ